MCSVCCTQREKKTGCKVLCRHTRTQKPAPFYAKIFKSMPGLSGAPAALCGVLASSSKSNKTKPDQVPDFFNPGVGRGRFVFPSSFPAGKAPQPSHSLHQLPCPGCDWQKLFGENILSPLFSQGGEKKQHKTQLRSRQIF